MEAKLSKILKENKKPILIIVISILAIFSVFKIRKLLKLRKFKYAVDDFSLTEKLSALALQKGIDATTKIALQNYSNSNFKLNQISIDLYTPSGEIIAEQKNPLSEALTIEKNNTKPFSLTHHIEPKGLVKLLKENQLIAPDDTILNIALKLITLDLSGMELIAKGFIVIEGISKSFNEKITL